jgi:homoserine kinase type II
MAVYTEVSDEALRQFMAQYDLGKVTAFKGIAEGVENTNYLLATEQGAFMLTLYEKRVKASDLPFFLGLMEHLSARGLNCPLPVHGRDGAVLRELAGRPAAITTFLDGLSVRRPTAAHCAGLGEALARLHLAGEGFALRRPNALSVEGWRPLFESFAAEADQITPGLSALIGTELTRLEAHWPRGLPAGVIHADLFPDNVFFLDGRLSGLIDFYFACNDSLAYDVAICLNAWCFEPDGAFNLTKGQALLRAYQAARPMSQTECDALPLLARGSALRFLLTRGYDWINTPKSALVRPKDPMEYVRKLRFHQSATNAAAYGAAAARKGA